MVFTYFKPKKQVISQTKKICKKDSVPINQIFSLVNEIYSKKDTTGLTDSEKYREFGEMIITAQGKREDILFSYYVLGNEEDENVILEARDENLFLCFNCDICAIDKADSVGIYSQSKLQVLKNVVDELCSDITTETGVELRLTPNATIYLPGHLLVSTRTHVPNYNTFLTFSVFQAYFLLIKKFYEEGIEVNCLWNGRTGSELYHSHCHLTDYKIPVVEYVKTKFKRLSQDPINIETVNFRNINNTKRDYIIVQSTDIKILHSYCSKFIMNSQVFMTDKFKKMDNVAVTGNFVLINHEGQIYYVIIFSLVNKNKRYVPIDKSNGVFCVPSTSQIMILPEQIELVKNNQDKIITYINNNLFYTLDDIDFTDFTNIYIDNTEYTEEQFAKEIIGFHKYLLNPKFTLSKVPKFLLKAEVLQYILGKGFNLNNEITADNFMKILIEYDCFKSKKQCNEVQFGFFKTILTCVFLTYRKTLIVNDDIVTNPKVFNLFEIAKKASLFKYSEFIRPVDITQCTWLRGDYLNNLLTETIGDVILYTPIEEIDKVVLPNNVRIGDASAFGYNLAANLKFIKNFEVLVKIQSLKTVERELSFKHENEAGKLVNTIRKKCLNFMLTFGRYICDAELPDENSPNYNMCDGNNNIGYLFVEFIKPSVTLQSFIRQDDNLANVYSCMSQVLSSVMFANHYFGFTHYDLHLGNILVVPVNSCMSQDVMVVNYHIDGKVLKNVCYQGYPVIIDYGRTYVNGMKSDKIYYNKGLIHYYGVTSYKSNKIFDLWTLFVNFLFHVCAFKPEFILRNNISTNLDIVSAEGIETYIKIMLEHYYFFFTQSGKKITEFKTYIQEQVEDLYNEVVNVCNIMILQPNTMSNKDKFILTKKLFKKGLFRNVYAKLGHEYVWNIPERFSQSVDADSLINDLQDLIIESNINIKRELEQEQGYDFSKIEIFEIK